MSQGLPLCCMYVLHVTLIILRHRDKTARSIVRPTTTNPAIMGISGNFMVLSTVEEVEDDHTTFLTPYH